MGARLEEPVRICFPFVGDKVGGSHISALKLLQNLDRRSFEPRVVLQADGGPLAALLRREGVPYDVLALPDLPAARTLSALGALAHLRRTVPAIRAYLLHEGFAIVHTNDAQTHAPWGLAARLAGARLVWHHRGDPGARGANLLAPLLAHRMIAVSDFARPARPVLPLGDRLRVVRSPFEAPALQPEREEARAALLVELGLPPETRVLGYFGNLVERKRPLLFVEAVHRIWESLPGVPVVGCLFGISLPGRPDLAAAARRRAGELGIGDAIRLMGFRQPVEPYLAATDILLVPAVGEPFGRGLIEAMFLGTPVVAVDHGGNPEAIEDGRTGFLVPPEDPNAFVEPVRRLLTDAVLFETIARAARETAHRAYGVERHVDEVAAVYRQLDAPPRRASFLRLAGSRPL